MRRSSSKDVSRIFEEGTLIDDALREAVRKALLQHKRKGNPIATWRNGKVVWIPAHQIEVEMDSPEDPGT
ncbi:MAG: hypothetical protein OXH06_11635 [Gemmatimonadetes bacterium]|nr:hypothetical protein [Gemmatimonadota bacterium]MDE3257518.1 hypothetical protein [Gemmatimonadota bacterium]